MNNTFNEHLENSMLGLIHNVYISKIDGEKRIIPSLDIIRKLFNPEGLLGVKIKETLLNHFQNIIDDFIYPDIESVISNLNNVFINDNNFQEDENLNCFDDINSDDIINFIIDEIEAIMEYNKNKKCGRYKGCIDLDIQKECDLIEINHPMAYKPLYINYKILNRDNNINKYLEFVFSYTKNKINDNTFHLSFRGQSNYIRYFK